MPNIKTTKETLNSTLKNLGKDVEILKDNSNVLNSIEKKVQNILGENNEDDQVTIPKASQSLGESAKSVNMSLTKLSNELTSLKKTIDTKVLASKTAVNSLLASNLNSLYQINSVLSAFRADFIAIKNGQNINGNGYYNAGLITSSSGLIRANKDQTLSKVLKELGSAGNYANLQSNAVRGKVGNSKLARDSANGEVGLIAKLLGKLSPDAQEVFEESGFGNILSMLGIDDTNIATTTKSILNLKGGKSAINRYFNPIDKLVNKLANDDKSPLKNLLGQLIQEKTGFGQEPEIKQREKNPNLVLSALAPFADDIKDIVKFKIQSFINTPKKLLEKAKYATPVWIVNQKDQKDYVNGNGNEETVEKDFYTKRLEDHFKGLTNNTKDELGEDLLEFDPKEGIFKGKLADRYFKANGVENKSYDEKLNQLIGVSNKIKEEKSKDDYTYKMYDLDENGEWVESEYTSNRAKNLANASTENLDIFGRIAMGDFIGGGIDLLSRTERDQNLGQSIGSKFLGAGRELKNIAQTIIHGAPTTGHHQSGMQPKVDIPTDINTEDKELVTVHPGELIINGMGREEINSDLDVVDALGLLSVQTATTNYVLAATYTNLVKYLNHEKIDPSKTKIIKMMDGSIYKTLPLNSEASAAIKASLATMSDVAKKAVSGISIEEKKEEEPEEENGEAIPSEDQENKPEETPENGEVTPSNENKEEESKEDDEKKKEEEEKAKEEEEDTEDPNGEATPSEDQENDEEAAQAKEEAKQAAIDKAKEEGEAEAGEAKASIQNQINEDTNKYIQDKKNVQEGVKQIREEGEKRRQKMKDDAAKADITSEKDASKKTINEKESANKKINIEKIKTNLAIKKDKLKSYLKQKSQKLIEKAKILAGKALSLTKRLARKFAKTVEFVGMKLAGKASDIIAKIAGSKIGLAIKGAASAAKTVLSVVGKGIGAACAALAGGIITLPVSIVPAALGIAGVGALAALLLKKAIKGKKDDKAGEKEKKKADKNSEKAKKDAEEDEKKEAKEESKAAANTADAKSGGISPMAALNQINDNRDKEDVNGETKPAGSDLESDFKALVGKDLLSMMMDFVKSELGKSLMKDPEKAANMMFSLSGGTTALGLKDVGNEQLKNVETAADLTNESLGGMYSDMADSGSSSSFNNRDGRARTKDIGDKSNNYSEDPVIALMQYYASQNKNETTQRWLKKEGFDIIEDENGNAASTSEILKMKQQLKVYEDAGLTNGSASVSSSTSTSTDTEESNGSADSREEDFVKLKDVEYGTKNITYGLKAARIEKKYDEWKKKIPVQAGVDTSFQNYFARYYYPDLKKEATKSGKTFNEKDNIYLLSELRKTSYFKKADADPSKLQKFTKTIKDAKTYDYDRWNALYYRAYGNKQKNQSDWTTEIFFGKGSNNESGFGNVSIPTNSNDDFLQASAYALNKGYKETDGGTYPKYFKDYLGHSGIDVNQTSDIKSIKQNLLRGNPVILMGKDPSNSGKTPFGDEYHYVVATGYDGKNITVEDSESPTGNDVYNADSTFAKANIKLATNNRSIEVSGKEPIVYTSSRAIAIPSKQFGSNNTSIGVSSKEFGSSKSNSVKSKLYKSNTSSSNPSINYSSEKSESIPSKKYLSGTSNVRKQFTTGRGKTEENGVTYVYGTPPSMSPSSATITEKIVPTNFEPGTGKKHKEQREYLNQITTSGPSSKPTSSHSSTPVVSGENTETTQTRQLYPKWVFCGDSRSSSAGIEAATDEECIAKGSMGYNWFVSQYDKIKSKVGYNIVLWFGVNGCDHVNDYAEKYNQLASELKGKSQIIFATIGPCPNGTGSGKCDGGGKQDLNQFNEKIKKWNEEISPKLSSDIIQVDVYSYILKLVEEMGASAVTADNLHYKPEISKKIVEFIKTTAANGATVVNGAVQQQVALAGVSLGKVSMKLDSFVKATVLTDSITKEGNIYKDLKAALERAKEKAKQSGDSANNVQAETYEPNVVSSSEDPSNQTPSGNATPSTEEPKNETEKPEVTYDIAGVPSDYKDKYKPEGENTATPSGSTTIPDIKVPDNVNPTPTNPSINNIPTTVTPTVTPSISDDNGEIETYIKSGALYVVNKVSFQKNLEVEEILQYFEELNSIQDDSLEVLEVIHGKLSAFRNKSTRIQYNTHSFQSEFNKFGGNHSYPVPIKKR